MVDILLVVFYKFMVIFLSAERFTEHSNKKETCRVIRL